LLARPETEGLSLGEIERLLVERLQPILEAEIRRRDRDVPTILLGHLMAERASLGAERFLAVGKGFGVPLSLLVRPEFAYVALGHVHKHQNLNPSNDPPVVYPGSIERVDFSEEKEEKGYVLATVASDRATWEFCPLKTRPFRTIAIDVSTAADAQTALLSAIADTDIEGAIARLHYKIRPEQLETINAAALQKALARAHSYTIRPELVSQLARPRVPELKASNSLDPISALEAYLGSREDLQDIAAEMLEAAQQLLAGDDPTMAPVSVPSAIAPASSADEELPSRPVLEVVTSPANAAEPQPNPEFIPSEDGSNVAVAAAAVPARKIARAVPLNGGSRQTVIPIAAIEAIATPISKPVMAETTVKPTKSRKKSRTKPKAVHPQPDRVQLRLL